MNPIELQIWIAAYAAAFVYYQDTFKARQLASDAVNSFRATGGQVPYL